ncbi:MAG TPA: hypothetical protein VJ953_00595 [Saprospiraceae bacterium]|nr:hypothetical protein [Saprospiraceae bacterium]
MQLPQLSDALDQTFELILLGSLPFANSLRKDFTLFGVAPRRKYRDS